MKPSYLASVCRNFGLESEKPDGQAVASTTLEKDAFSVAGNAEHEMLLDQVLADTSRPDLPVLLGKGAAATPTHLGYFTVFSSVNLGQAIDRLLKYYPILEPGDARLFHNAKAKLISFDWRGADRFAMLHSGIQMVQLVQMARFATGAMIIPKNVSFGLKGDAATMASYQAFFGVDITFDGGFHLTFDAADLNRQFAPFDQSIWKSIETDIDQRLYAHMNKFPIEQMVQRAIEILLPQGPVSLEDVAGYLAIGRRTLQRRLKQNDVKFGDLLDQTRLGLVKRHLQSKSISRAAISYQLGFHDPNSFYRLYRGWVRDGKLP